MGAAAERIVITGVGLTSPNGNDPAAFRHSLLSGVSGVSNISLRYIGEVHAGVCTYDPLRYQNRKDVRNGTRAGSIAIYCANEALRDAGLAITPEKRGRTGVYVGITEHGNVETENEIFQISRYNYDVKYWTHYHNPRTVANNPAGEVTVNLGITGPHYCIGAACAAGNAGLIQGAQQLQLGEVDLALAGGVSESIHTFGIFASFKSQNALAHHADPTRASRPFDLDRNGVVVSEGGALFVLERLADARRRGARILGELLGWALNSDASHFVLPNPERQAECIAQAIARAGIEPRDVDLVNTHATSTPQGDIQECDAIRKVFGGSSPHPLVNNTKGFIGHAMGAAGALEIAGNLGMFTDGLAHPCLNVDRLDPQCALPGLVLGEPRRLPRTDILLSNSFGMLGINSTVVIRRI